MVGLLAAVGTVAASGLVGLVHGGQSWAALGGAAALAGLSYVSSSSTPAAKKNGFKVTLSVVEITHSV
jgi:hypothetical protein